MALSTPHKESRSLKRTVKDALFCILYDIAVIYHQLGHTAVDADVLARYCGCFVFEKVNYTFLLGVG